MNIEIIGFVIMAISIPLAGIIGFSIQLRDIRKLRLENDKLGKENSALKAAQQSTPKTSVDEASYDTLRVRVNDISPSEESIEESIEEVEDYLSNIDWRDKLIQIATLFLLCYFLYDIYRLGAWLYSLI